MEEELKNTLDSEETVDNSVEESVETTEEAEQSEEQGQAATAGVQSKEENARYAAIRRRAEADAKRKYEEKNAEIDGIFRNLARQQGVDGINSAQEYAARLQQDKMQRDLDDGKMTAAQIQAYIDEQVNNSPYVRQAKEALVNQKLEEDLQRVRKIDKSISSIDDILNSDAGEAIIERVKKGQNLYEAYAIENFEKLQQRNTAAAKQAAINQANGKSHMNATQGNAGEMSNMAEIPSAVLGRWQDAFPDDTPEQLRARYNKFR